MGLRICLSFLTRNVFVIFAAAGFPGTPIASQGGKWTFQQQTKHFVQADPQLIWLLR